MRHSVLARGAAAALTVVLAGGVALGIGGAKARKWERAAAMAKREGKIILAEYAPGSARQAGIDAPRPDAPDGPAVAQIGEGHWFGAPDLGQTLRNTKVRAVIDKHVIIAALRQGDQGSMWEKFKSHFRETEPAETHCLFASPDGDFLGPISTEARVNDFMKAFDQAWAKYEDLRKNDPEFIAAQQKRREQETLRALLDEADQAILDGRYAQAVTKADEVLKMVKENSVEARRATRVKRLVDEQARQRNARADAALKQGKAVDAFRELDEVAHLFVGLDPADEARKRLEDLLAQSEHAEAASTYADEREVYDVYEEGLALEKTGQWKEALARYTRIADEFKDSPVTIRAARRAKCCREEIAKADDKD